MPSSVVRETSQFSRTTPPETEAELLNAVLAVVGSRLPESWTMRAEGSEMPTAVEGGRLDALWRIRASDGREVVLAVEAKRLIDTRDVPMLVESLSQAVSALAGEAPVVPVLAARYLAPATRERVALAGAGYVDATGNVRLISDRPAFFLADRGADRDPWRGPGRPRGTLKGPPAARVVRALTDFTPPYTVPELADRADTSTGATYRVVDLLEREDLLRRERYGPIVSVDWRGALERWARDYSFAKSGTAATFLEPRGLPALTERLVSADIDYVVTGSIAAQRVSAYAPPRMAAVYVRDIALAAETLELRPVDSGANVALATTRCDVVFDRADVVDHLRVAALSQVAVDLLGGPGREPAEAEALLDWMTEDESRWRR